MRRILVYAGWQGLEEPRVLGYLTGTQTRGQEVLSFEYDADWLEEPLEDLHQL